MANQINTDYKHGLDAQDAEKQHGYRLDELRTREELERGRPLSEKDKAAIGLTNAQADYYRREKGKEKESSEGLKTQVDALKAIIKAGEGAPEGSPELINARNASAALGQLTGLGAGPRMDETKARAQAEKEAGSKAGLFRSDRTDFGPDGREKWINDRTQALMYGKSEGNPAPDAAPAVAGKQGGDYLGDLLNRAGVEGGKPSARQPAKTATAEPPGLLSRVPKPNVSLNNSMAGDQINQAKGLLS
ncbi:MAG: hypothetical protein OEV91_09520, partial [Desulfobulbaceae bacterium]|nr:hypothetical protein [Desulfobulbaceae bacterium]